MRLPNTLAALTLFGLVAFAPTAALEASTVGFSQTQYGVDEGGIARLTVTLDRSRDPDLGSTVTVKYKTVPQTASEAPGNQDYTPRPETTLSFAPGETSKQIDIQTTADNAAEGTESFEVILYDPSSNRGTGFAVSLRDRSATVTIFDGDGATVQFSPSTYSATEGSVAILTVSAIRFGDPNTVITVDYATSNGTANSAQDYGPTSGTVTFNAGETQKQVSVNIATDGQIENPENFIVALSNPVNADLNPNGSSTATVNIADVDSGTSTIQFNAATQQVDETAGSIALTVLRSGGLSRPVSVNYQTANGSATAAPTPIPNPTPSPAPDYAEQSNTLNFAAGETQKTITIRIFDDTAVEQDETFTTTLLSPSAGAMLGDPAIANVTIKDDDAGRNSVQFNPTSYAVSETAGNTFAVEVTRSGALSTSASVNYATSNGTATAGADYNSTSGTVVFAPGETQRAIPITILDDRFNESGESFFVTLSDPSGVTIGAGGDTATVTISDNDADVVTIQFSSSSYGASEDDGEASLTVVRSGGVGFAASAQYSTADLSAKAGTDYVATSSTVSFAPGEISKTIAVPVIEDGRPEGSEAFTVMLFGPSSNATVGSPGSATVIIFDDDPPDTATKLGNISTRGPVKSGDEVMIAGFIIAGSAQKDLVLRGIGPSLTQLGVPNAIADPSLTLFDGNGNLLAFNDDHPSNSQADRDTLEAMELTPQDTRESAIVANLSPAAYTAILRGKTNGVGLLEVYDVSRTSFSRFVNISTRSKVERGDNGAMIAGFISGAPPDQPGSAQRLVVRTTGPSLASAGVSDALEDTTLELYRGSQRILLNDNWKTNSQADQQELKANGLAPKNDKESALVVSLEPGSYTAVVRGKDDATGVALVEVYLLQ